MVGSNEGSSGPNTDSQLIPHLPDGANGERAGSGSGRAANTNLNMILKWCVIFALAVVISIVCFGCAFFVLGLDGLNLIFFQFK